jgi:phospholipase A1
LDFDDNKGAIAIDWSRPMPYAKDSFWYVKVFSGYGESLIDYNRHINKLSLGFSFSRGLF